MPYNDDLRQAAMKAHARLIAAEAAYDKALAALRETCSHDVVVQLERGAGPEHRICIFCGVEDRRCGGWSLFDVLSNGPREVRTVQESDFWRHRTLQPLIQTVKT